MFSIILIALATYTCMIVSDKLRRIVSIAGTVVMLVYCIAYSIFPLDKLFEKIPINIAILVFLPCTIYLIGLVLYMPIERKHKDKKMGPPPPPHHNGKPPPPPPPPHLGKPPVPPPHFNVMPPKSPIPPPPIEIQANSPRFKGAEDEEKS